jgi:hypothetical protein
VAETWAPGDLKFWNIRKEKEESFFGGVKTRKEW